MSQVAPDGKAVHALSVEGGRALGALLWILAVAAGVSVANLYYSQPLLEMMARDFRVGPHEIGLVPTLTQIGYAAGMLLVVPLGDAQERRRLIVLTCAAAAVISFCVALAPTLPTLLAASFALGLATCAPQLAVPYAAGLVPADERGRSVGKVMSGLLIGILLSRTVSGLVGAHLGWRSIYFIAGGAMVALSILLRIALPVQPPERQVRYIDLLRSLPGLVKREPLLRRHALLGALAFASFSAFWTTLAFLLSTPPYHYGSDVAGLFGIVGVAGALAAPLAGRVADRRGTRVVNGLALACVLLSWIVFGLVWRSLFGIAVGVVLLDAGVQASHISNQTRVLGLSAEERNRLNTVYMVSYFAGGATGSMLGAAAFASFGWPGVAVLGLALIVAALAVFFGFESEAARRADEPAGNAAPRQAGA
jgi:predicted MFS family arabinose efflux permease